MFFTNKKRLLDMQDRLDVVIAQNGQLLNLVSSICNSFDIPTTTIKEEPAALCEVPPKEFPTIMDEIDYGLQRAIKQGGNISTLELGTPVDVYYREQFALATKLLRDIYDRDTQYTFRPNHRATHLGDVHRKVLNTPESERLGIQKVSDGVFSLIINARAFKYQKQGQTINRQVGLPMLGVLIQTFEDYLANH